MNIRRFIGLYSLIAFVFVIAGCATAPQSSGPRNLFEAAQQGNLNATQDFIAKGANPNMENRIGATALMAAATYGHTEVVRLLLDHAASANAKVDVGKARRANAGGSAGATALIMASESGHTDVVQVLLDKGADIDAVNAVGFTALMFACQNGQTEVVQVLLDKGANVNLTTKDGATALYLAAYSGNIDTAKLLLDKGTDTNIRTASNWTPLMAAAYHGTPETVQLLIDNGADKNSKDTKGNTAFCLACNGGNVDTALYLYETGVDVTVPDSQLETNGSKYHILGDYFLAQDNFDNARDSYERAGDYYTKTANEFKNSATKLAVAQFGVMLLQAALEGAVAGAAHSSGGYHSYGNVKVGKLPAMHHAPVKASLKGYSVYKAKYNKDYVGTTHKTIFAPLVPVPSNAPLEVKKQFAQENAKRYEGLAELMKQAVACFSKGLDGDALHACVENAG